MNQVFAHTGEEVEQHSNPPADALSVGLSPAAIIVGLGAIIVVGFFIWQFIVKKK